jgi:hypothetical protein
MISSQLERIARERADAKQRLSVYNFSRMGYTTAQELIVARTYAPDVKPDQIILGFFIANDIVPNAASRIDEDGNFAPDAEGIARIKTDVRSRLGLLRHSVIWRVASLGPFTTRLYYEVARQPFVMEKNRRLLDAFREDCERQHIALTVVMMYAKDGVRGGFHGRWTQSREAARMLVDYCRTRGIQVIDMLDIMNGPDDCRKYLYPSDGHFTPVGCQAMARGIFDRAIVSHLAESR